MADQSEEPAYKVEVQPAGPPPPAILRLRNSRGFPRIVVTEDEAFEMYLALKAHFEGEGDDREAQQG